jgi:rhomboid protease GluP
VAFQEHQAFEQALMDMGTRVLAVPILITMNVLIFVLMAIAGINVLHPTAADVIRLGSNYGPQTLDGQWWRLFTSMFLHLGLPHLLFNMAALVSLGPLAERLFGSGRFLLLYLFAGLCGSVSSLLWNPNVNSAGASGAIFGVLGGLLAFMVNPKTKIPASVSVAQRNSALVFVAYNLLNGVTHAGIDNACHIGGLVSGFAVGWLLARPLESEARHEDWSGLLTGVCLSAAALLALSWPLAHPSPEQLVRRQLRKSLMPFAADEAKAMTLTAKLDKLRRNGTITDEQWAERVLNEVVPLWQAADDDVFALDVPAQSEAARLKGALLGYLDSRRLGVELNAEATKDHDPGKAEWAQNVIRSSDVKAQGVAKLMNSAVR